jgi:hypothetical protein
MGEGTRGTIVDRDGFRLPSRVQIRSNVRGNGPSRKEPRLKFIAEHFLEIILFAILWNVAGFGWFLWKRRKKGLRLPQPGDADVVFLERFASGSSHKSLITRLGGANNCLTVIITRTHLAITTFFPFTAFVGQFDLEHLIPRDKIIKLEKRGAVVDVEFLNDAGSFSKMSLRLRSADDFIRAFVSDPDGHRVKIVTPVDRQST